VLVCRHNALALSDAIAYAHKTYFPRWQFAYFFDYLIYFIEFLISK